MATGTLEFNGTHKCQFCGGKISVSKEPRSVMHTVPACEKFMKLDVLDFLIENRRAAGITDEMADKLFPIPKDA